MPKVIVIAALRKPYITSC